MLNLLLAAMATPAVADKIVGSVMIVRHGDRTAKSADQTVLTPIGEQEQHEQGSFFHSRYFNTSSDFHIEGLNTTYQASQISASVPNSAVLQNSQLAFLQSLYPPISTLSDDAEATVVGSSLSNGTDDSAPLNGYQYVTIQGIEEETPDAIWIEGASSCPAAKNASKSYYDSDEFKKLNESTYDFYQGLYDLLGGGVPKSKLNYQNAYTVYDYYLVNMVHNKTFYDNVKDDGETYMKVKTLQDQLSKALNYNSSNPDTYIAGKTLSGKVLSALNETKTTGKPFLTLMHASYSTFYSLFGALDLFSVDEATFTGLVNYASAAAFELFEKDDGSQYVQFSFRNGTESTTNSTASQPSPPLTAYRVLGSDDTHMDYDSFVSELKKVAITDLGSWCSACSATLDMCIPSSQDYLTAKAHDFKFPTNNLTLAGAGGIGAGVTLGVCAIVGGLVFLFLRRRRQSSTGSDASSGITHVESATKSEMSQV